MTKATVKADQIFAVLDLIKTPLFKLKATGETRTNRALIETMLSVIPEREFKKGFANQPFLDPCCGRGTFLLSVVERLLKYHQTKDVISMIKGIDIDSHCVYTTKEVLAQRLRVPVKALDNVITKENYLTWDAKKMKFKVIAGNPPFQEGGRIDSANKLWPHFVKKSDELLADKGYIAMITPTGWMQPTADIGKGKGKNATNIFNDIFKANNLILANIDSDTLQKIYFAGVGSTFSYFVYQKAKYAGSTKFITPTGTLNVDINTIDSLPKTTTSLSLSISKKMQGSPFKFVDQNHGINGQEVLNQDSQHPHKLYHTNADGGTYRWGEKSIYANSPKVIITTSGRYLPLFNDNMGFSNMCMALICKTKDQALQAEIVLHSKLYRFWVEMQKFSGFVPRNLVLKLPAVDLTQKWDDQRVYTHFNLSTDEIAFIEGMFSD